MSATTLGDLVGRVARAYGHYLRGTATGGSTSTVVDSAALTEANDFWNNHRVYIVEDAGGAGAAPEGEERQVTDHNQGTTTLTVSPAFTAAVATGDVYEILPARRDDIVEAINQAIRSAGDTWLVPVEDTSSVTVGVGDFDYSLPADLVALLAVWRREDASSAWTVVPPAHWRMYGTPGSLNLYFNTLDSVDAGDTLRLDYLARVSQLEDDTDTLGIGEPAEDELVQYVVEYAQGVLHYQAGSRGVNTGDFRARYTMAQTMFELAESRKRKVRARWVGTVHPARWTRSRG